MNDHGPSVRVARLSDADDIARLTAQLGYEVETAAVSARLTRILDRPDQRFLIAELGGRTAGWLHAAIAEFVEADPFVVIGGLVVDSDQRRKGIGRLLLDAAEQWAKAQGCSVVRLWSSTFRTDAHRFYERSGYTNIKTQHSFAKPLDSSGQRTLSKLVPRSPA